MAIGAISERVATMSSIEVSSETQAKEAKEDSELKKIIFYIRE